MQDGGNYDFEARSKPRHFGNFETSLLARNVGLAMDTMWTWNFSNPNTAPAAKLRVELRSPEEKSDPVLALCGETPTHGSIPF